MSSDIETGSTEEFHSFETSTQETRSSFESTDEERTDIRVESPKRKVSVYPKTNSEWAEYIKDDSKHLIKKCRKRSRRTSWYSALLTYANDLTNLYIIFFSLATFIVSSIKTSYEPSDYVLIGMGGLATLLESVQMLFKYKKRSIYFKQASLQYKRIYRRLNKYLYTASTDTMADYLSLAYQDVDKLVLNDHRANFNKFNNKSYGTALAKTKSKNS